MAILMVALLSWISWRNSMTGGLCEGGKIDRQDCPTTSAGWRGRHLLRAQGEPWLRISIPRESMSASIITPRRQCKAACLEFFNRCDALCDPRDTYQISVVASFQGHLSLLLSHKSLCLCRA